MNTALYSTLLLLLSVGLGSAIHDEAADTISEDATDLAIEDSLTTFDIPNFGELEWTLAPTSRTKQSELETILSEGIEPLGDAQGGLTGAAKWWTVDRGHTVIVKVLDNREVTLLTSIWDSYNNYLDEHPSSLLVRMYGLLDAPDGRHLVVMGNALSVPGLMGDNAAGAPAYDLKGDFCGPRGDGRSDTELRAAHPRGARYKSPDEYRTFRSQMEDDTAFLASHALWDYSLLVAVDENGNIHGAGIIDFLLPTIDNTVGCLVRGLVTTFVATPVTYGKQLMACVRKGGGLDYGQEALDSDPSMHSIDAQALVYELDEEARKASQWW